MHAISSCRGNRPTTPQTHKQTNKHTNKQTEPIKIITAPLAGAQCNEYNECAKRQRKGLKVA